MWRRYAHYLTSLLVLQHPIPNSNHTINYNVRITATRLQRTTNAKTKVSGTKKKLKKEKKIQKVLPEKIELTTINHHNNITIEDGEVFSLDDIIENTNDNNNSNNNETESTPIVPQKLENNNNNRNHFFQMRKKMELVLGKAFANDLTNNNNNNSFPIITESEVPLEGEASLRSKRELKMEFPKKGAHKIIKKSETTIEKFSQIFAFSLHYFSSFRLSQHKPYYASEILLFLFYNHHHPHHNSAARSLQVHMEAQGNHYDVRTFIDYTETLQPLQQYYLTLLSRQTDKTLFFQELLNGIQKTCFSGRSEVYQALGFQNVKHYEQKQNNKENNEKDGYVTMYSALQRYSVLLYLIHSENKHKNEMLALLLEHFGKNRKQKKGNEILFYYAVGRTIKKHTCNHFVDFIAKILEIQHERFLGDDRPSFSKEMNQLYTFVHLYFNTLCFHFLEKEEIIELIRVLEINFLRFEKTVQKMNQNNNNNNAINIYKSPLFLFYAKLIPLLLETLQMCIETDIKNVTKSNNNNNNNISSVFNLKKSVSHFLNILLYYDAKEYDDYLTREKNFSALHNNNSNNNNNENEINLNNKSKRSRSLFSKENTVNTTLENNNNKDSKNNRFTKKNELLFRPHAPDAPQDNPSSETKTSSGLFFYFFVLYKQQYNRSFPGDNSHSFYLWLEHTFGVYPVAQDKKHKDWTTVFYRNHELDLLFLQLNHATSFLKGWLMPSVHHHQNNNNNNVVLLRDVLPSRVLQLNVHNLKNMTQSDLEERIQKNNHKNKNNKNDSLIHLLQLLKENAQLTSGSLLLESLTHCIASLSDILLFFHQHDRSNAHEMRHDVREIKFVARERKVLQEVLAAGALSILQPDQNHSVFFERCSTAWGLWHHHHYNYNETMFSLKVSKFFLSNGIGFSRRKMLSYSDENVLHFIVSVERETKSVLRALKEHTGPLQEVLALQTSLLWILSNVSFLLNTMLLSNRGPLVVKTAKRVVEEVLENFLRLLLEKNELLLFVCFPSFLDLLSESLIRLENGLKLQNNAENENFKKIEQLFHVLGNTVILPQMLTILHLLLSKSAAQAEHNNHNHNPIFLCEFSLFVLAAIARFSDSKNNINHNNHSKSSNTRWDLILFELSLYCMRSILQQQNQNYQNSENVLFITNMPSYKETLSPGLLHLVENEFRDYFFLPEKNANHNNYNFLYFLDKSNALFSNEKTESHLFTVLDDYRIGLQHYVSCYFRQETPINFIHPSGASEGSLSSILKSIDTLSSFHNQNHNNNNNNNELLLSITTMNERNEGRVALQQLKETTVRDYFPVLVKNKYKSQIIGYLIRFLEDFTRREEKELRNQSGNETKNLKNINISKDLFILLLFILKLHNAQSWTNLYWCFNIIDSISIHEEKYNENKFLTNSFMRETSKKSILTQLRSAPGPPPTAPIQNNNNNHNRLFYYFCKPLSVSLLKCLLSVADMCSKPQNNNHHDGRKNNYSGTSSAILHLLENPTRTEMKTVLFSVGQIFLFMEKESVKFYYNNNNKEESLIDEETESNDNNNYDYYDLVKEYYYNTKKEEKSIFNPSFLEINFSLRFFLNFCIAFNDFCVQFANDHFITSLAEKNADNSEIIHQMTHLLENFLNMFTQLLKRFILVLKSNNNNSKKKDFLAETSQWWWAVLCVSTTINTALQNDKEHIFFPNDNNMNHNVNILLKAFDTCQEEFIKTISESFPTHNSLFCELLLLGGQFFSYDRKLQQPRLKTKVYLPYHLKTHTHSKNNNNNNKYNDYSEIGKRFLDIHLMLESFHVMCASQRFASHFFSKGVSDRFHFIWENVRTELKKEAMENNNNKNKKKKSVIHPVFVVSSLSETRQTLTQLDTLLNQNNNNNNQNNNNNKEVKLLEGAFVEDISFLEKELKQRMEIHISSSTFDENNNNNEQNNNNNNIDFDIAQFLLENEIKDSENEIMEKLISQSAQIIILTRNISTIRIKNHKNNKKEEIVLVHQEANRTVSSMVKEYLTLFLKNMIFVLEQFSLKWIVSYDSAETLFRSCGIFMRIASSSRTDIHEKNEFEKNVEILLKSMSEKIKIEMLAPIEKEFGEKYKTVSHYITERRQNAYHNHNNNNHHFKNLLEMEKKEFTCFTNGAQTLKEKKKQLVQMINEETNLHDDYSNLLENKNNKQNKNNNNNIHEAQQSLYTFSKKETPLLHSEVLFTLLKTILISGNSHSLVLTELARTIILYVSRHFILLKPRSATHNLFLFDLFLNQNETNNNNKKQMSDLLLLFKRFHIPLQSSSLSLLQSQSNFLKTVEKSNFYKNINEHFRFYAPKTEIEENIYNYFRLQCLFLHLISLSVSVMVRYKLAENNNNNNEIFASALTLTRSLNKTRKKQELEYKLAPNTNNNENQNNNNNNLINFEEEKFKCALQKQISVKENPQKLNQMNFILDNLLLHYVNTNFILLESCDSLHRSSMDLLFYQNYYKKDENENLMNVSVLFSFLNEIKNMTTLSTQTCLTAITRDLINEDTTTKNHNNHNISFSEELTFLLGNSIAFLISYFSVHRFSLDPKNNNNNKNNNKKLLESFVLFQRDLENNNYQNNNNHLLCCFSPSMFSVLSPTYFNHYLSYIMTILYSNQNNNNKYNNANTVLYSVATETIAETLSYYFNNNNHQNNSNGISFSLQVLLISVSELLFLTSQQRTTHVLLLVEIVSEAILNNNNNNNFRKQIETPPSFSLENNNNNSNNNNKVYEYNFTVSNEVIILFLSAISVHNVNFVSNNNNHNNNINKSIFQLFYFILNARKDIFGLPPLTQQKGQLSLHQNPKNNNNNVTQENINHHNSFSLFSSSHSAALSFLHFSLSQWLTLCYNYKNIRDFETPKQKREAQLLLKEEDERIRNKIITQRENVLRLENKNNNHPKSLEEESFQQNTAEQLHQYLFDHHNSVFSQNGVILLHLQFALKKIIHKTIRKIIQNNNNNHNNIPLYENVLSVLFCLEEGNSKNNKNKSKNSYDSAIHKTTVNLLKHEITNAALLVGYHENGNMMNITEKETIFFSNNENNNNNDNQKIIKWEKETAEKLLSHQNNNNNNNNYDINKRRMMSGMEGTKVRKLFRLLKPEKPEK